MRSYGFLGFYVLSNEDSSPSIARRHWFFVQENISDVEDHVTRDMVARVAARARCALTGQRLDIYGICERCSLSPLDENAKRGK